MISNCVSSILLVCYIAYCPLGKWTTPLGGGQNVPQSWAPVIDQENGWVRFLFCTSGFVSKE